jgi:S-(hydroxymethyl)glutathione dehydrogenase/alcohol dehydrogenase
MSMPKTMKAAVLMELGKPLVIAELTLPEKLDVGQVLVKVHYSGICGSQIGEIDGAKGEDKYLPHLLGHEGSGTVVEVGAGVRYVKPGDKVVLHWRKGAGIEAPTPSYLWNGRKINAGWVTTFNEHAVVSENRVTPVPAEMDLAIASLFGCAVTTGFGVVENNARLRMGESIAVFGAGGIGLNIVQAAALASAHPIIAIDQYDNRLALARTMGATHTINTRSTDVSAAIIDAIGTGGLDVFVDNTGNAKVIELGYQLTHGQGRVTLVGVPRKGQNISIHSLALHFGKVITGSHGGETVPELDIPRYARLYRSGRFELKSLLTNAYELDDINEAISDMTSGKTAGRCLIKLQAGSPT